MVIDTPEKQKTRWNQAQAGLIILNASL